MISCSSIVSIHCVPSILEDVKVLLCCFRGLLGGCVHFNCALNDGHDALLTLPHVMCDIAYHEQEGHHVLLVLPSGLWQLILELCLDVRGEVMQYQVICSDYILDPGVLVLLLIVLYNHKQIQV